MDYQAFLRQLESSTLPASEFTHQAHLYAAWAYRRQYPAAEAAVRCARALSRYAMAQGAAEKYHHTLTMSLLSILYHRAQQMPAMVQEWPVFLAQCDDVLHDAKAVLFQYYSDDRLNQDVARRAFVPPDRMPLPIACLSQQESEALC